MTKPEFKVDISDTRTSLEAYQILCNIPDNHGFHLSQNVRPPLGIYNVSILRISERLIMLSTRLEEYFSYSSKLKELNTSGSLLQEIVDYLELALYAAAEHVDDLYLIAEGFYNPKLKNKKTPELKLFDKNIKVHKKFISGSANAIKHQQARVRIFSAEIKHAKKEMCLHGFFIEGVNNGIIGPSQAFHTDKHPVFSVTSILWEIICFVLNSSRHLKNFLSSAFDYEPIIETSGGHKFTQAILAASRLPLYTFGEAHPFNDTRVILTEPEDGMTKFSKSDLYGSLRNGWVPFGNLELTSLNYGYEGDGVSASFKTIEPANIGLSLWT